MGFDWAVSLAHFMVFGFCSKLVMCVRPLFFHWFEKVSPNEPKMEYFLCGEWYCVMFMGHVSGIKK